MTARLTIIGGAFGSGKTEFAIACAQGKAKNAQGQVGLVDLDIINPYFRSRDITDELGKLGVDLVSTPTGLENSDIPALSPRIYAFLQDPSYQVVFDVGGDPVGARALGPYHRYFQEEPYDFWVVVNPFRPDTREVEKTATLIAAVEEASRLHATGIISNINLGPETTVALWQEGLILINELTARLRLPLICHMVEEGFLATNAEHLTGGELFPVRLRMLPPWLKE